MLQKHFLEVAPDLGEKIQSENLKIQRLQTILERVRLRQAIFPKACHVYCVCSKSGATTTLMSYGTCDRERNGWDSFRVFLHDAHFSEISYKKLSHWFRLGGARY